MIYLCKFLLVILNHILLHHVPKNCFQDHSIIFPGTEARMTSLWFLTCLKMDMTFVSLQSLGIFCNLHDLSKMMEKIPVHQKLSQYLWMPPIWSCELVWVKISQKNPDLNLSRCW